MENTTLSCDNKTVNDEKVISIPLSFWYCSNPVLVFPWIYLRDPITGQLQFYQYNAQTPMAKL